jgi:phage gpG-like protein
MDEQNQITIGHIARNRMKGNNNVPFPVEEHILGVRTARLRGSLPAGLGKARVFERAVESSIGSNVVYAAVHEFGSTKRNIPARQPIYYGVMDKAEDYGHAISEAIVNSWRNQ